MPTIRVRTVGQTADFVAFPLQGSQYEYLPFNARVEFATSMVSFERVFEVLDLPIEIEDRPSAASLERPQGNVCFENVSFSYLSDGREGDATTVMGLEDVPRFGWRRHAAPPPLSGGTRGGDERRATPHTSLHPSPEGEVGGKVKDEKPRCDDGHPCYYNNETQKGRLETRD